ncbi:MAG: 30S ribosomal protein S16 [Candidatus Woesebacteria bacterium]|nr:30S ribosomal protein S16 [Candidatus Woesebacteria bacterium]
MSVSIKLSRFGAKNNAFYRIVAVPTRSKRDGKSLEIIGSYDPHQKKTVIDKKKFEKWVANGAIVTGGVKKILK